MYTRELSNFSRLFYSLSGGSEGKLHLAPRGSLDPRRARRRPEWATEPGSTPAGGRRETPASRNVKKPGAVIWDAEKSREEDWWGFRERSAYRHLLFEIFLIASGRVPRCTQVLSPTQPSGQVSKPAVAHSRPKMTHAARMPAGAQTCLH